MFLKVDGNWLIDGLRTVAFFLDSVVFPLIAQIYELFMDIANTTIFTEEIIDLFASKVYALLGIFMLFKVSFSIMTYIINPDEFADKNKGFSKLISNIVITLALLLFTPWVFSQAMDIQRIILKDNIIGKVFSIRGTSNIPVSESGKMMAYETFRSFYRIDSDLPGYEYCKYLEEGQPQTNNTTCQNAFGASASKFNDYESLLIISHKEQNVDYMFDYDLLNQKAPNGSYVMEYLPFMSTIAGGFVALLLINFCFDVAIRSIKLGFLRMIAPVPIISRIDPKKGKDVFDKWLKECIKTYLDLFIRLLAIYFAIFVVAQVVNMNFIDQATGLPTKISLLAKAFIIMGALLFAKQLPKLLSDLTGAKLDGKFTLNPFKRAAEVPVLGKSANLLAGGADSMVHGNGFFKGIKRNWDGLDKFIAGGDGKTSIFETADRKMRREVHTKRDSAKSRYEAIEAEKKLHKLLEDGEDYKSKIILAGNIAEEAAKVEADRRGLIGTARDKFVDDARKVAESQAERRLYGNEYYDSKKKVDDAKAKMYAWDNYVTRAQEEYSHALNYGTEAEKQAAFKKYEEAKKNAGSAKGQYDRMQKEHEHYKATHEAGAKIEDAVDAFEKMGGKKLDMPPVYQNSNSSQDNSGPNNFDSRNSNSANSNSNSPGSNNPNGSRTSNYSSNDSNSNNSESSNYNSYSPNPNNSQSGDSRTNNSNESSSSESNETRRETPKERADREMHEARVNELRKKEEEAGKKYQEAHQKSLSVSGLYISEEKKEQIFAEDQALKQEHLDAINELEKAEEELEKYNNENISNASYGDRDSLYENSAGVRIESVDFDISKYMSYANTDKILKIKADPRSDEITTLAEKLMRCKENNIKAETVFNGIHINNWDHASIEEIRRYYMINSNK